jgi:hypothetical protein
MERLLVRIKWRPAWDDEGVASTVGTILALLVFLTFLSLLTNQYVPVWMNDAEAAHMNEAFAQFGVMKSSVDNQVLSCTIAQIANRACTSTTSFSPITLGVDGVPIFSGPTMGFLSSLPAKSSFYVEFSYLLASAIRTVNESSNGTIELDVRNRFYIPQQLTYENGAIVRSQPDGEVIRARPQFSATDRGSYVEVQFDLITLFGQGSAAGVGTEGIHMELLSTDVQEYTNLTSSIWINHTTEFPEAWYRFFNDTLSDSFGVTGDDYENEPNYNWSNPSPNLETSDNPFYFVRRTMTGGGDYWVYVELKNDPSKEIRLFVLSHAWLDVELGEGSPRI